MVGSSVAGGHKTAIFGPAEVSVSVYISNIIISVKTSRNMKSTISRADLVNQGPQANIEMGPHTFAHIYQDQL